MLKKSNKKREGFRKAENRLPLCCLPGAMRLHELIDFTDISSKLKALKSDYPIRILEIQKLMDTSMFRTDVKQVFDAIRLSKDQEKFKHRIKTDPAFTALDIETDFVVGR